jgi:hypothetical protein
MFSTLERTKRLEEYLRQKAEAELSAAAVNEDEEDENELVCEATAGSHNEEAEDQRYSRSFGRS